MLTIDSLLAAGAPPIVAILRGVKPAEAVSIAGALVESGIRMIEVPLNSPDPFSSISAIQNAYGKNALIGAGTVLDVASVDELAKTGARLMVTPNADPAIITRGVHCGLEVMPGVLTPTEAFAAIHAGARRLKLFPAFLQGTNFLKAVSDVLPAGVRMWAVGGVNAQNAGDWLQAGAEGVAFGTALYRPGDTALDVSKKAEAILASVKSAHRPLGLA